MLMKLIKAFVGILLLPLAWLIILIACLLTCIWCIWETPCLCYKRNAWLWELF